MRVAGRKRGLGGFNVGAAAQLLPKQRPDRPTGINADRRGDIQKLQHVKTPIPALIFRHVGWRLAQPFGHHRLCQAGRFAPRLEQFA